MPLYLFQFNHQPKFHWDQQRLARSLGDLRFRQGRLLGGIGVLGSPGNHQRRDEIEDYDRQLTEERLSRWHGGAWRNAGLAGAGIVHASSWAIPVTRAEIRKFLSWFNTEGDIDPVLKAAIAHLWFMVIRPFSEDNEEIAHRISDMQLCRADGCATRYYHVPEQMRRAGGRYEELLGRAREGATEITVWLEWFLDCLDRALAAAERDFAGQKKERLIDRFSTLPFNDRQRVMIRKLLDEGGSAASAASSASEGIGGRGNQGGVSSSQWARIAGCSQDTALRDIQDLMERRILVKEPAGGRSTQYILKVPDILKTPVHGHEEPSARSEEPPDRPEEPIIGASVTVPHDVLIPQ